MGNLISWTLLSFHSHVYHFKYVCSWNLFLYCSLWCFVCWLLDNTESAATPLYHCCVTLKKMLPSEINLPCDIILVELWSSSYAVLTIKCVFILIMVRFFSLCETKYETPCTQLMENVCDIKYCVCKKILLFYNSFFPVWRPSTFQFIIFFGTGFEVHAEARIHNVVCIRTVYSLVHGCECFGGTF